MVYKKYHINILVRVILLLLVCFLLSYLVLSTDLYYTIFGVACVVIFLTISLINYFKQTTSVLEKYFAYFKEQDTSINLNKIHQHSPSEQLTVIFDEINNLIKDARIEKQHHYQYLQFVIEHIPIGLLAIDQETEKIKLTNKALLQLLHRKSIKNFADIEYCSPNLRNIIENIAVGKDILFRLIIDDDVISLSIRAAQFKIGESRIKLVSLQNINQELDIKEVESWQKLIRILTHEIMNSVSPIIGLAQTTKDFFIKHINENNFIDIDESEIDSIYTSINLIGERSQGLKEFVEKYRNITKISNPVIKEFPVEELFTGISLFFKGDLEKYQIICTTEINPPGLTLNADQKLIEQILINLLKNAIDSVKETEAPKIQLSTNQIDYNKINIQVSDNGPGISKEDQEKIFLPFFTTKEEGSGIGLSISKQIMQLHGGNITVKSNGVDNTTFTLGF